MKYIPGFTFTPQEVKKGGSVLEQAQLNRKIKRNKTFKFGVNYKIHHVVPSDDGVKYIFLADNQLVEMKFNSIKEAEEKISKVLGE